MDSIQEKLFLLKQLIEFAKVDGVLHDKEMDFLKLLSADFGIDDATYYALYQADLEPLPISFSDRIIQFYKLTLLMQCDGVWHNAEIAKLHEIGIMMGLNPIGIDKLLAFLKTNSPLKVTATFLENIFTDQLN